MPRKTTTLRSFDIPKVKGEGSVGTFEDASIVPRKRFERDNHDEDHHNNVDSVKSSNLLICAALVLVMFRF